MNLGRLNDRVSFNDFGEGTIQVWYENLPDVMVCSFLFDEQNRVQRGIERAQEKLDKRIQQIKEILSGE